MPLESHNSRAHNRANGLQRQQYELRRSKLRLFVASRRKKPDQCDLAPGLTPSRNDEPLEHIEPDLHRFAIPNSLSLVIHRNRARTAIASLRCMLRISLRGV